MPGFNSVMTEDGVGQIRLIREQHLEKKLVQPALVVVGTGSRFQQTYNILAEALTDIPVKYSLFCGGTEGWEAGSNRHILCGGRIVPDKNYIGLENFPDWAWQFLKFLPEKTLLCAGEELMIALDLSAKPGNLYEVDTVTHRHRQAP